MPEAEQEHISASLRLIAVITMDHIKTLPIQQQIMACDGLQHALSAMCPDEARAALAAADALRRAEAAQMNFAEMLHAA